MEQIQKDSVAVIDFTLKTIDGILLEKGNQLAYLHGYSNLLIGMEEVLEGEKSGNQFTATIAPEKAFGLKDANKKPIKVNRSEFGNDFEKLSIGMSIPTILETGENIVFYLLDKDEQTATLTLNHPLAGVPLIFDGTILKVRKALCEEIENNMAFGPNGDQKPSSCACC